MNELETILRNLVQTRGPIPLSDYMAECLFHPAYGYYSTRNPLGAAGDFITAPEISQMFGELIGLSLAQSWLDQGAPARFALTELGPGRGTLMADALRAARAVPGFSDAAEVHLVEASPPLRAAQKTTLAAYAPRWHDTVNTLPEIPLYLIANEFFDALPIRQYQRASAGWSERCIGADGQGLRFGLAPPAPLNALSHRLDDTAIGDIVEHCPAAPAIITTIGQRIKDHGGAALIIDYGDWRSLGDTLQALRNHQPVNPLAEPGKADLTAHVDFEALAHAAPCGHTKLTPQGLFLERLGITGRAQALATALGGDALKSHVAAHRRLTHPDEMGTLFKVLGFYPANATPPPGLEP
ncbi:class I SAM-dependent methyltransferase [Aquicoccus sp. G2-2]|uniref:class I SAM-dependent methyltransferase n=1 Tax=Aquicoccus sp. G2-2 TaxID=3092120 RepID=UPI002AE02C3F|nr:SAM-dependent methyltransferase [Aquicoccus sp. G2-2]MEA1112156.1 SAM-dependent methyltransferase [Aquicoccus sp. G2-2]